MIDTLEIYKLSDIAKMEWISYRTAQRRAENGKLIPVIIKDKKEKIRYFDSWKTKMILTKKEMKDEQKVTMKNGRKAMKGKCSSCGTGMYKILGK